MYIFTERWDKLYIPKKKRGERGDREILETSEEEVGRCRL